MPTDNKILNGSGLTTLVSLIKRDIDAVTSTISSPIYYIDVEYNGEDPGDEYSVEGTYVNQSDSFSSLVTRYNNGEDLAVRVGNYVIPLSEVRTSPRTDIVSDLYFRCHETANDNVQISTITVSISTSHLIISRYVTSYSLTPWIIELEEAESQSGLDEGIVRLSNVDQTLSIGSIYTALQDRPIILDYEGVKFYYNQQRDDSSTGMTFECLPTEIGSYIIYPEGQANSWLFEKSQASLTDTDLQNIQDGIDGAYEYADQQIAAAMTTVVTPTQSDWAQATTTSLDYIKNKPHLPEYNILEYIGKTASPVEGDYSYYFQATDIVDGATHVYKVPAYTTTPELKYQVTTKEYVDNAITTAIGGITGVEFNTSYTTYAEMAAETGAPGVIYLIPNSGETPNIYDEYIYANSSYEKIGTTEVDLSNYVTTTDMSTALTPYALASDLLQSDWNQTTTTSLDYIKNKPAVDGWNGKIGAYEFKHSSSGGGDGLNLTFQTQSGPHPIVDFGYSQSYDQIVAPKFYTAINMNGHSISGLTTPTSDTSAANKKYVDDQINAVTAIIPSDTLVEQNPTTEGANLPIILKSTTATVGVTSSVKFSPTTVYVNPSSGKIKANRLEAATLTLTDNGVACGEIYGYRTPVYDSIIIKPANGSNSIEITRDDASGTYVSLGNKVRLYGITTPARNDSAANKKYVDDSISTGLTNYVAKSDVVAGLTNGVVVATVGGVDIYAPVAGEAPDLSGYVPSSRTVNGHALTTNISLTASDVGAATASHTHDYSKVTATAVTTTGTTLGTITVNNNGTTTTTTIYAPAVTWAYDTSTGMLTINGVGITTT